MGIQPPAWNMVVWSWALGLIDLNRKQVQLVPWVIYHRPLPRYVFSSVKLRTLYYSLWAISDLGALISRYWVSVVLVQGMTYL